MVRDESVAELYRRLDPADLLYDYLIGSAIGLFGSGAGIAAGQNAEANRTLRDLDANEAAYLRRMEEIGHLRPEGDKNAALDGTADGSPAYSQGKRQISLDQMSERPSHESDDEAFSLWSTGIGLNDTVKTLAEYFDIKYNDPPRYSLIKRYVIDVDEGWISPLCGFENYERLYNRTQNELVGKTTTSGIVITGQSRHFLQRLIGTARDPLIYKTVHRVISRSGVSFEDILETIEHGTVCPEKTGVNGKSQAIFSGKCIVTINPETGFLIQCNPQ